ncbi:MAG: nucleoside-diphosphate kinase [Planctomycetaceae bacterium]|nr:nucleoside-diphosphate kinase [Planctomycetaceae bacterium]
MERTLTLLKPDAIQRQLIGRIVERFEAKGLKIVAMKFLRVPPEMAADLYEMHRGKEFYPALMRFIAAGPVLAMVLEGVGAVNIVRTLMGSTFGPDAAPGTIRGDFGASRRYNLVHGSDSMDAAQREIPIFFAESELIDYDLSVDSWIYARHGRKTI